MARIGATRAPALAAAAGVARALRHAVNGRRGADAERRYGFARREKL
jgi:hypothetical protein